MLDRVKHGLWSVMLFGCVGALWMLRNDVVFNSKVLAFPMAVIHKTIMLFIYWKPVLKTKTLAMAEALSRRFSRALWRREVCRRIAIFCSVFTHKLAQGFSCWVWLCCMVRSLLVVEGHEQVFLRSLKLFACDAQSFSSARCCGLFLVNWYPQLWIQGSS